MKTMKKALLFMLCAALVVSATVFGTLAYLTDTETVTNTFTVGKVYIDLDEANVNPDGTVIEGAERVQENEYHLLPGHTYIKDPTVTVEAGSEDAYVRMLVKVENIDQLIAALPNDGATAKYYGADGTFLLQMLCNGWDNATWTFEKYDTGVYEFRYKEVVAKAEGETKLPALFQSITVPGEIDNAHLAELANIKIVVTAHAIQADGFANADAAWAEFQ